MAFLMFINVGGLRRVAGGWLMNGFTLSKKFLSFFSSFGFENLKASISL